MDGPSLIDFTLSVVPPMVEQVLTHAGLTDEDVDLYLMHQATLYQERSEQNRVLP